MAASGGGSEEAQSSAKCPMAGQGSSSGAVFNVYSQRIDQGSSQDPLARVFGDMNRLDPNNMMPVEPNQSIAPGQRVPLPTAREQSTIPKGGTEGTWTYPSSQMFFNALKRKGKGDDVVETDVDVMVAAHNTLNEATWRKVLQWESLHADHCQGPKLLRFLGRPDKLSPKAWFKSTVLRQEAPFDRHDWIVDRCGEHVRYVIDFYYDENRPAHDAFVIDARPALDSMGAAADRAKMAVHIGCMIMGVKCPITGVDPKAKRSQDNSAAAAQ
ncbi:unnamed protein product [Pedinophyceae sp. YPF-701]|nr:unnamed protein product [Pedinophyceae sp. YPF-701]